MTRLMEQFAVLETNRISIGFDCGFPLCMLDESALGRLWHQLTAWMELAAATGDDALMDSVAPMIEAIAEVEERDLVRAYRLMLTRDYVKCAEVVSQYPYPKYSFVDIMRAVCLAESGQVEVARGIIEKLDTTYGCLLPAIINLKYQLQLAAHDKVGAGQTLQRLQPLLGAQSSHNAFLTCLFASEFGPRKEAERPKIARDSLPPTDMRYRQVVWTLLSHSVALYENAGKRTILSWVGLAGGGAMALLLTTMVLLSLRKRK